MENNETMRGRVVAGKWRRLKWRQWFDVVVALVVIG